MRVLGMETSCDETAVAIVEACKGSTGVLANLISSQVKLHEPYGGVVPEVAVREHMLTLPRLVPEILKQSRLSLKEIDAIAVTEGPGLASALLIGYSYARALAVASDTTITGVNHLEGHLFSPFLANAEPVRFPFIGLVVSGGHTLLVQALGFDRYVRLGQTVDDAAGEAFDKVARLVGLNYPGGPEIEKLAAKGDPDAYAFPRSFPDRNNFNFSFSGLKTAVRYFFEKNPHAHHDEKWVADLCASFQRAVTDVLVRKAINAVLRVRGNLLVASGGVMCNQALRNALTRDCEKQDIKLLMADPALCTDNAAMIAAVAAEKLESGMSPRIADDINPNLDLFSLEPDRDLARGMAYARKLKDRQLRNQMQKP